MNFVLCRTSANEMRCTPIREGNLLYSKVTYLNVNLIQRHSQKAFRVMFDQIVGHYAPPSWSITLIIIFTQKYNLMCWRPPDYLISSPREWLLPWLIRSFHSFEPTLPDEKPIFIGTVNMGSVLWFRFTLNKFTDCVNILMFVYTKFQHVPWQWKKYMKPRKMSESTNIYWRLLCSWHYMDAEE